NCYSTHLFVLLLFVATTAFNFPLSCFLFFFLIRRPPSFTLFPYTTLFRSHSGRTAAPQPGSDPRRAGRAARLSRPAGGKRVPPRSEEHTSELQSRENLVCRLLLEKKK